jgi:hypothetical protein
VVYLTNSELHAFIGGMERHHLFDGIYEGNKMEQEDIVDEAEIELEDVETEGQEIDSDSSPDTEEVQEKQTKPDWQKVRARFDPY